MTDNKPEVVGFATHHDEPMLFPNRKEAAAYCEDGEEPIALIRIGDYQRLQAELERERKCRFDGNEQASREHREDMKALVEALEWYSEQVSGCRKITSEGDWSRAALDRDGGTRAREALATYRKQQGDV